jgi:hypothetical protein
MASKVNKRFFWKWRSRTRALQGTGQGDRSGGVAFVGIGSYHTGTVVNGNKPLKG